jgi:hypothetical protein
MQAVRVHVETYDGAQAHPLFEVCKADVSFRIYRTCFSRVTFFGVSFIKTLNNVSMSFPPCSVAGSIASEADVAGRCSGRA